MSEERENDRELLLELMEKRAFGKLREVTSDMNPADIAAIMDSMENEESLKLFRILQKDLAAEVFPLLEDEHQQ